LKKDAAAAVRWPGSATLAIASRIRLAAPATDVRPPGGHRLQRLLRLHLLPPAVPVQPVRRPGAGDAPARQSRQRQVLATGLVAGDRTLSGSRHPQVLPGDSAFALPKLLRLLEKEGFRYAIRLKANPVLERKIAPLLKRPVGRPSRKPKKFYASFRYRAGSWDQARRVVAKVEWHAGELFPRVGFIVTNLKWPTKRVVRFYNRRGTAEQWIKEGKNAVKWTKLSCRRFKDNEVRLQLFALAYNLANFLRQLVLPKPIQDWTLTTLREKLIKIGAKVVAHAKYLTFQLAEVTVPRKLFARILERIARLRPACASG
jgi:Transposase DDE domain group 1